MMKRRIRPHLVAFETRRAKAFARAASGIPLSQVSPLLPVDAFRLGPVVLANNALAWGGVERQVVNTLKGLEGLTDRPLHLLCLKLGAGPDYDFYLPALDGSRCEVRNAAEARTIRTALSSNRRAIEALIAWMPADVQEDIFRYLAEFLRLKPEVVHAWQDGVSLAAGFAARIAGVPRIIVSSRNMNPTNFAYFRPYMQRAYRELADCSDIIMINNSEAGVRDYAAWLDLPPTRWIVVRNGLNHQEFRRAEPGAVAALRRSIGISDGVPIVGSVFRFYDEKRPMLWVETAALLARRHPTCHFVVFGTGPMRAHMLAAAATAGFASRLHLPGPITQTPVALSLFDAFLLTSSLEGTPNVVLEASAVGVPVVATDAGGTREAVEEGVTGFVVADPAPHTLAERLNEILEDLDRWRVLREQGPAFVESRFGLDRMLNETLSLYGISDTRAR
jgi:glycosyltransferase involved in cell wall biosynthesis